MTDLPLGTTDNSVSWLRDRAHRAWLAADAERQLALFDQSLRADGGFDALDTDGSPLPRNGQELHTTARLVHSYALGQAFGHDEADRMIDAGMSALRTWHRDDAHGGYVWWADAEGPRDGPKLAYGHVFVLLAASSAKAADHPDADALLADIAEVLDTRFWDDARGLLCEEYSRDWSSLSDYRGMNANMHGVEAMLAAHIATGERCWLDRAGRILSFFTEEIAPDHDWRLPEHYDADWQVDPDYSGDPMFRPAGTTPGHSLELGRLILEHWDLEGRPDNGAPDRARKLIETALWDGWRTDGGMVYTLHLGGNDVAIADRYWWPVTEGIGALAALIKLGDGTTDELWYRRLWRFAESCFVDPVHGGWHPEIDATCQPVAHQFAGKPDIYHALQATLFPLTTGLSRHHQEIGRGAAAAE
ncbi:AGE family epimerase/isomerase [Roseivivax sediminis]|uniref:Mannose or cellobiose epimerase, N-acyl-D-glucosamine 2-epimerase family n=1 Tax=Roseivivax sediminis TaxID=936889 RepID=A0A1I1VJH8_9RHOB|nr:AGE family epimerase/isomerase [Roseivivax sediminis]SFD82965.1 Mannose or cellobiose epimerase, N-acyl-D-glucosamine 2-epimerase family [Roseivivax sediminis]